MTSALKRAIAATAVLAIVAAFAAVAQDEAKAKKEHVILAPDDIKWGDAPPILPAGAKAALLDGDPKKEGYFVMRLKLPAGYKVAPHWHPGYERLTVISGKFHLGLGEKADESKMKALPAGGFFSLPPKTAHYAMTSEETVVQINTDGPWALNYVNPSDDPSKKK